MPTPSSEISLDIGLGQQLILPVRENLVGGLKIARHFSKEGQHPYANVEWVRRTIEIKDYASGKIAFSREHVEVPMTWGAKAVQITVSKYLFGGSDPTHPTYEDSLKHAFDRISNTYTVWGWKHGYFATEEDALIYNHELKAMLLQQIWAPNSPVWFNIGHWEQWRWGRPDLRQLFKGKGNKSFKAFRVGDNDVEVRELDNTYVNPQASACFLTEVDDSMEAILHHQITEGRVFASGSGIGLNISTLRSSFEPIAGKGRSSGPIAFDKGWDRMAGAIKSGGKCLAPWQKVYTQNGPVTVKELTARGGHFICLSYDPMKGRIMAKPAIAWQAGTKQLVEIRTDKGLFALSADHPVRLADETILPAGQLQPGMALHAGSVDISEGYLRVNLQNGKKGKEHMHRLVARDVLGKDIEGLSVHHIDENPFNNNPENLEVITQAEHAGRHGKATALHGRHVFQRHKFPKKGVANAMHSTSAFWGTKEAEAYRQLQGKILTQSGRASSMQASSSQRMLNVAWRVINAGHTFTTFESYVAARQQVNGRIGNVSILKEDINKHFGSFDGFLKELASRNHRVISVEPKGHSEVYDVEVTCPSPDDKTAASGHNFLIWSNEQDGSDGSGIFVLNTRRAARMLLLYSDHPDILQFITTKNQQENLAKIVLREHNTHIALRKLAQDTLKNEKAAPECKLAAKFVLALPLVTEQSYDGSMDGLVYGDTVAHQNANHSVSLKGDFWQAYKANGDYSTRWVCNRDHIQDTFKASSLLDLIAKSIWDNAEPGIHNNDWINLWNPVKNDGSISTSNPCCFVAETVIITDRGEITLAEIQKLAATGKVLPKALTRDGYQPIKHAWVAGRTGELIEVTTSRGVMPRCTPDHPFILADGTERIAAHLRPGDQLAGAQLSAPTLSCPVTVVTTQRNAISTPCMVFDMSVEKNENFAINVGGQAVFVHNSEYLHLNNTSCNLSSFNIYRFLGPNGQFDGEALVHAARLAMIAADLNIEEGGFPIPEIAKGTYLYRTTGIGFANIGGSLMALGIPYDSDEGRWIASQLTSILTAACWTASAEMGRELGHYMRFTQTKENLQEVLNLHNLIHEVSANLGNGTLPKVEDVIKAKRVALPSAQGLTAADAVRAYLASYAAPANLKQHPAITGIAAKASELWKKLEGDAGRLRNSFTTVYAPTGTISAPLGVYDAGTTSAEPDYSLVKFKNLAGGGTLVMFNEMALTGLRFQGYSDWHVKEAALEVAGINGLLAACDSSVTGALLHLRAPMQEQGGPVRQVIQHIADTKDLEAAVIDLQTRARVGNIQGDDQLAMNGKTHMEAITWLKSEHLAAFDCSATNGDGTRSIAAKGHMRMLGAVQPFLSGSTSKTTNLPHTATEADIKDCLVDCHKMGVKCVALFRADSKGVSVYQLDTPEGRKWAVANVWNKVVESVKAETTALITEASLPKRVKLPGRRQAQVVKFVLGNMEGFLSVGVYEDGRCGEVFGWVGQGGSFADGMFQSFCKSFSISLQYGVPLHDLIESFRYTAFDPAGFVNVGDTDGKNADIKSCKSVIDLMMQTLEWLFPDNQLRPLRPQQAVQVGQETVAISIEPVKAEPVFQRVVTKPTVTKVTPSSKAAAGAAAMCPKCKELAYIFDGKCRRCRSCSYSEGGCGE